MMNDTIVGMGEAMWDVLPEGKKMGGAPANFAYHISQFGLNSRMVSAVGNDPSGEEILKTLAGKGLKTAIETVPHPTGMVLVEVDEAGIPRYNIKEDVAWDYIPFTPDLEALAQQTCAVCFGSLAQRNPVSRQTIHQFLDAMPDGERQYKIFDINLRQHFYSQEIICNSLRKCNILKINDEELAIVCRMLGLPDSNVQTPCRMLIDRYNLKMLILTCGANGSHVFSPDAESFVETPKVKVADTVGAGDSFTATFTAAMLSGKSIRKAHQLATEVAAYVCTQNGAMPLLPQELKDKVC